MVTLGTDPAEGVGSVNVHIQATPIVRGALAHSYYCGDTLAFPSSQKFDGISATSLGPSTWFFTSADAYFSVQCDDSWRPRTATFFSSSIDPATDGRASCQQHRLRPIRQMCMRY